MQLHHHQQSHRQPTAGGAPKLGMLRPAAYTRQAGDGVGRGAAAVSGGGSSTGASGSARSAAVAAAAAASAPASGGAEQEEAAAVRKRVTFGSRIYAITKGVGHVVTRVFADNNNQRLRVMNVVRE